MQAVGAWIYRKYSSSFWKAEELYRALRVRMQALMCLIRVNITGLFCFIKWFGVVVPLWNRNIYFGWCWSWHVATLPLNGVTLQIYFTGALVSLRLIDSIVFIWSPLSPMLLFASACCQEVSLSIVQEDTITLVYEYLCLPGQPLEHLLPVVQAGGE